MDRHKEDQEFLADLRHVDRQTLVMLLRFQSCEMWKKIAIEREMLRRTIPGSSNRQDDRL